MGKGMQPSPAWSGPLSREEALAQLERLRDRGKMEGWQSASAKIVVKRAELLLRQDSFCKEWTNILRNRRKIKSMPSDERDRVLVKFSEKWNIRGMHGWMPTLPAPVNVEKTDLKNGRVTVVIDLNLPVRELQKEILPLYGRLHRTWELSFPERQLELDKGSYKKTSKKEREKIRRKLRRNYKGYLKSFQSQKPSPELVTRIETLGFRGYNPGIAPSRYAYALALDDANEVYGLRISSTETLKKKYLYCRK
jgi:hypothetical protein